MTGTETWDYMAAASLALDETDDAYRDAAAFLLGREASDAAVEFARLIKEGVPDEHARMAVQLTIGHGVAMGLARRIMPVDYEEWRGSGSVLGDTFGYSQ